MSSDSFSLLQGRVVRQVRQLVTATTNQISVSDHRPLQTDVGSLEFAQLVLNKLLGSDLGIQSRLQLQTSRHVQFLAAPHFPKGVLKGETVQTSVTGRELSTGTHYMAASPSFW